MKQSIWLQNESHGSIYLLHVEHLSPNHANTAILQTTKLPSEVQWTEGYIFVANEIVNIKCTCVIYLKKIYI